MLSRESFPLSKLCQPMPKSFCNQQKTIESCNSKQMDYSNYSIASQESTQFSDYNSQTSSDENFKGYNHQNNFKSEIFEDSPNSTEELSFSSPPQFVIEYASEIFSYLKSSEDKFLANANYMKGQKDITEHMRAILVDWLVDVHYKYGFVPETLFLTINLMDRYLSKVVISRTFFQLVGITSLFIASKYEEVYVPDIKDFAKVTENAFSVKQILEMEGDILSTLQFDLTYTSPYIFLERYGKLCNFDEKSKYIAEYLLELSLLHYKMVKYPPSLLASSAIYVTLKINKTWLEWPQEMICKNKIDDLLECSNDLLKFWINSGKFNLNAVKRKFSRSDFHEVSKMRVHC